MRRLFHPHKPRIGGPGHKEWVLERVRAYLSRGGRAARDAFVHAEKDRAARYDEPHCTNRDTAALVGPDGRPLTWLEIVQLASAAAPASAAPVDFSELDFDDEETLRPEKPAPTEEVLPAWECAVCRVPIEVGDRWVSVTRAVASASGMPVGSKLHEECADDQGRARERPVEDEEPASAHALFRAKKAERKLKFEQEKRQQLEEELAAAYELLGVVDDLKDHALAVEIVRRETASGLREVVPVLLCSDWHPGEVVRPETINYLNEYNPEIAERRVRKLVEGLLWELEDARARYAVWNAIIWLGGDLINNWLHDEDHETNAYGPTEEVMFCKRLICTLIDSVLVAFPDLILHCPTSMGNHGRITKRKRFGNAHMVSLEWLMYEQLKERYAADERVHFYIARGAFNYVRVADFMLRFNHGDQFVYRGGIGGIEVPMRRAIYRWNTSVPADITHMGHWHKYLPLGDAFLNGSLVGYNGYAQSFGIDYEPPQQAFYLLDTKRGPRRASPLWVDADRRRYHLDPHAPRVDSGM